MNAGRIKRNLIFLYFLGYGSLACYFPFLAVYFQSRGLSYIQSGFAFSLSSLVSIGAQPLWGYVTDKYLNKRLVILINMLACSVIIFLYVFAYGFIPVMLSVFLLIFFQSSVMSIADALCYEISGKVPQVTYGQIRLVGSVGFAVLSLVLGALIERFGININFYIYSALFILAAVFLFDIRFKGEANIVRPSGKDILEVLKNYKFIVFVFSIMLLNIATGAHSSYVPTLIEATGGDVGKLGFVWFAQAMSEIPIFYFGSRLVSKYSELNLYIAALVLYIIRLFLSSISPNYYFAIAVQLMQGVTFPLYMVSAMHYVNVVVPEKVRASGITLLSALGFGLGSLIGNFGGGFVLQYSNPFFLYKLLTIICALALAVALILKAKTKAVIEG
jgi:MFS family permease